MGKLLDEDTVIKVLEHWKEAFKENSHHVSASDLSLVIKDVRELPPAQPEPHDLVSRQAALDALDKQIKQCCKALGSLSLSDVDKHAVEVEMASLRAYRGMLENLPTVQPEPQWIPVSERLPRDGSWNIFTDGKNISVERYKADAIDHFFPNGRWFQLEDAAAWMPLPEAYKPNK